jgi:hypothetical protein
MGMTLSDAVKSGRPFRRPGWEAFVVCPKDPDKGLEWLNDDGKFWPRAEDVTAEDYEIKTNAEKWALSRAGHRKALIAYSDLHDAYQAGFMEGMESGRTCKCKENG